MHELGIAQSVLDAVRTEMALHQAHGVSAIGLRIGPLAGVARNSLEFCFEALVKESEFASTRLAIEEGVADELEFSYLELELEKEE